MQRLSRGSRNRRSVLADEAERHGLNTTYTTSAQQLQNADRRMPNPIAEHAVTPAQGMFMTPATARTGIPRRKLEMLGNSVRSVGSSMNDLRAIPQPQSARSTAQRGSMMHRAVSLVDLQQSQQSQSSQRSPGLMSSRAGGAAEGHSGALITGTAYYPDITDRETLSNMAKKIVEVLEKYGFRNRSGGSFTSDDVKRINSKDFNCLCLEILGRLCYPYEHKGKEKAQQNQSSTTEELKFIKEVLQKIGFPLTFNVTQLVTIKPNSPIVLTVLSFLCCIYEELMEVDTGMEGGADFDLEQQAELYLVRSITQLCGCYHDGGDLESNFSQELSSYKIHLENLAQATDVLEGKTLDQVKQLIEEKSKELRQLLAVPDPGKELRQRFVAQQDQIESLKQRLGEIRRSRDNYQDARSLEQEKKTLELELLGSERQLAEVLNDLARQNITPKELEKMKEKLVATEQQIETLKSLVDEAVIEKKKKEEFVKNDQQRCYEEIARLKIVDSYNREASKLSKYSVPKLDTNPVDLDELGPWLKQMTAKGRFVEEQLERSSGEVKTALQAKTLHRKTTNAEVNKLKALLEQERISHQNDFGSVDDIVERKAQMEQKKHCLQERFETLRTENLNSDEQLQDAVERLAISKDDLEKLDELAAKAADEVEFQSSLQHSTAVQRIGELTVAIREDLEKWNNPFDYDKMLAEVQAEVKQILKREKAQKEAESSANAASTSSDASAAATSSNSQQ